MRYDLSKTPAQNRPNVHSAGKLHWAPDSRAIIFNDMVANNPAIVLVTLDEHGKPSAFRHPLTEVEICGGDTSAGDRPENWRLDRAEFGVRGHDVAGHWLSR